MQPLVTCPFLAGKGHAATKRRNAATKRRDETPRRSDATKRGTHRKPGTRRDEEIENIRLDEVRHAATTN